MRHHLHRSHSGSPVYLLLLLSFFLYSGQLWSQQNDSTISSDGVLPGMNNGAKINDHQAYNYKLTTRRLIIPVSLITYGVFSQANEELREFDRGVKGVVRRDGDFHTPVDDYLQYVPGLSVYALNAIGIKGRHNFRDRTLIYLLSNGIMGLIVQSGKMVSRVQRPDGYGTNAFPSGHTATAFVGAEFLHQEYKDVSPWYGVSGFAAATATGILRMYNNKHWLRDVITGAGIGILATQTAYWVEPIIAKKLFHKKNYSRFNPASY